MRKTKTTGAQDDKKLQGALKKLNVQPIPGVEEVNMFREDGNVLHFSTPKGQSCDAVLMSFAPVEISLGRSIWITMAPAISCTLNPNDYANAALRFSSRRGFREHFRYLRCRPGQGAHRARPRYSQPARP